MVVSGEGREAGRERRVAVHEIQAVDGGRGGRAMGGVGVQGWAEAAGATVVFGMRGMGGGVTV